MKPIDRPSTLSHWLAWAVLAALASTWLCGCAETYCQSGPKSGTQCFNINDVELQRTQQREEPWPAERTTEPSPGCLLATPTGLTQQPLNGAGSGSSASVPPPYLMSGACVSRQQPVYGALR
jgi:hypothetical protein